MSWIHLVPRFPDCTAESPNIATVFHVLYVLLRWPLTRVKENISHCLKRLRHQLESLSEAIYILQVRTVLSAHSWIGNGTNVPLITHWPTCQPVYRLQCVPSQRRLFQQHQHPAGSYRLWRFKLEEPRSRRTLCSSVPLVFIHSFTC